MTRCGLNDAMRAHCVDAGKLVMYAVNRFPPQYRDLILLDAKTRMDEEARTLNWLLRLSGLPDDMPPDATRN